LVGNGTDADKFAAVVEFAKFLIGDTYKDCLNISAFENDFWYIWASDGNNGFLLDLIKRPDELELRLDLYSNVPDVSPIVSKQYLGLNEFSQTNTSVSMGPITLTNTSCVGSVNGYDVSVFFDLSGRTNQFLAPWIEQEFDFVPKFVSSWGNIIKAQVSNVTYSSNLPLVYSTYPIKIGIQLLTWVLIDAPYFENTDLQISVLSSNFGDLWVSSSYVYYQGEEYHFNDPVLEQTSINDIGEIENGQRLFSASISSLLDDINLNVTCQASVDKFALLDKEGATYIHTTVLGNCVAIDLNSNSNFISQSTSLLEVKSYQ